MCDVYCLRNARLIVNLCFQGSSIADQLPFCIEELALSRCNELEDVAASESVSHDVEDLRTALILVEEEMRHFL